MLSFSALSYPYLEVQDEYNPTITDTSKLGDLEGLELGYTHYSRWVITTQLTCMVKTVPEDLTSLDTDTTCMRQRGAQQNVLCCLLIYLAGRCRGCAVPYR